MPLSNPPIQENATNELGKFRQTWIFWFQSIARESASGWSGSFTNGDGDTVTVVNGKITDVSS